MSSPGECSLAFILPVTQSGTRPCFLLKIPQVGSVSVLTHVLVRKAKTPVKENLGLSNTPPWGDVFEHVECSWKGSCLPRWRGVLNGFASTLCRFSLFYSRVFLRSIGDTLVVGELVLILKPVLRSPVFHQTEASAGDWGRRRRR